MATFHDLPVEILQQIILILDLKSLLSVRRCSQFIFATVEDLYDPDSPSCYRRLRNPRGLSVFCAFTRIARRHCRRNKKVNGQSRYQNRFIKPMILEAEAMAMTGYKSEHLIRLLERANRLKFKRCEDRHQALQKRFRASIQYKLDRFTRLYLDLFNVQIAQYKDSFESCIREFWRQSTPFLDNHEVETLSNATSQKIMSMRKERIDQNLDILAKLSNCSTCRRRYSFSRREPGSSWILRRCHCSHYITSITEGWPCHP